MPDFLLGLDLCFLFCDYTTRHVRCQDTCVYYCKGVRKYAGKGIQTENVVGQSYRNTGPRTASGLKFSKVPLNY